MKVMIRIPFGRDYPDPVLVRWTWWLLRERPDIDLDLFYCSAGPAEARNRIARTFLESDATHLWMIDSDTVPPEDLTLLDHDYPVLCGWYRQYSPTSRDSPFPCVFNRHPRKVGFVVAYPQKKWPQEDIFTCDAVGTGCMLIRRDVLERFAAESPIEPFVYGRHKENFYGEDITFCLRFGELFKDKIRVLQSYHCRHYRIVSLDDIAVRVALAKHA